MSAPSLSDLQNTLNTDRRPPLEKWAPSETVDFPIIIKDNGDWLHEGTKIERHALIKLFSSVLWGENGQTFLKTPTHLYRIGVENAPFLVVGVDRLATGEIIFTTTTDDKIILDNNHLPYFAKHNDEWIAYVPVRFGLLGKISRSAFYHLVELGELSELDGQIRLTLKSGDTVFDINYPIDN